MNSQELSNKLKQEEHKMNSLTLQMDNLYIEIQDAMPHAAASWMNKEVESKIKDNPEVAQSHGIEKLKELKSKLTALIEKLPEIVAAEFQDRSKWTHHVEFVERSSSTSQKGEPHLNLIFRNVISNLGGLLDEYGLIKEPKGHIPTWQRTGQESFRYSINPGMNNLPESKTTEYWNLFNEYKSISQKIKDIQKSINEAKAKELWDKA